MDKNTLAEKIKQAKDAHKKGTEATDVHGSTGSAYLKDFVYGASDGIVTTFAVVAGVAGARLDSTIVLILGFANLIADGLSMAIGNYLGTKSENELHKKERDMELWEIEHLPKEEEQEIRDIYAAKGITGEALEKMISAITKNKELWADEMMVYEHGVIPGKIDSPIKNALATFVAFVTAGFLPLMPYVFNFKIGSLFNTAIFATAVSMFAVGSLRSVFTKKHWIIAGFEMLGVGAIAAIAAYAFGYWIEALV